MTARFEAEAKPPLDLLKRWIDESYRAVAPKKLVARLAAAGGAPDRGGRSRARSPKPPKARKASVA